MAKSKPAILITGSAGFIGGHLYNFIANKHKAKYNVFGIDDLSGGFMRNVTNPKNFTKLDLRNRTKTGDYIKKIKPEVVFHLAADATEGRSQFTPFSALDRNLVSYMNLLIPAIKNGMKTMAMVSSMSVYGKSQTPFFETIPPAPEDIYGIMKTSMEKCTTVMAKVYGFRHVILRPHNVYGPLQNLTDPYRNVIGIWINCLLNNKKFYVYGDGEQQRAFSYIDDVIPAMERAAFEKWCDGQIVNIGSDEPVTLNTLAKTVLEEFFNGNVPKKFAPGHLADRPQEVKLAFCAHETMKKLLGHNAEISLKEGIKKTVAWARTVGPQKFRYLDSFDLDHKLIPKTWKNKLY